MELNGDGTIVGDTTWPQKLGFLVVHRRLGGVLVVAISQLVMGQK